MVWQICEARRRQDREAGRDTGGERRTHELLDVLEEVLEREEGELGLDVGVLAQVATRVALLGTERLLDAEDVAEARQARLEVQLRALREVGLLAVVVEPEQGRTPLDLGLHHARRRHLEQAEVDVRLAERRQERGADLEDRRGVLAADDEVASVGELRRVGVLDESGSRSARRRRQRELERRTSLTLLRKASSPPGALPTTANQSAVSSWPSGAVLPSGSWLMTPVIWTVDSSVRVRAS